MLRHHLRRPASSSRPLPIVLGLVALVLLAPALPGCGKGGKSPDAVLATVGDRAITAGEYSRRLAKQEAKDLPRGEDGAALDMASREGKLEFLQTLINKELMLAKADQMGYFSDQAVVAGRRSILEYEAGMALWEQVVGQPSRTISEEELNAFYARMGDNRICRYVITNFLEDAQAAREFALTGADWDEVVAKYHDGGPPPGGQYVIEVPFGRYGTEFETPVYAVEVGGITEPVLTMYGYWILKVDQETHPKEGKKPRLEDAKAQILDTAYNRKVAKIRNDFRAEVRKKYDFVINEDALWICYQGLPEGEVLLDPQTNEPTKREVLKPLEIAAADFDLPFYSYTSPEGPRSFTLGDYKVIFDRMSVFQRPKRSDMLGSLRNSITQEIEKALMNFEAQSRGFMEDPEVVRKADDKIEEAVLTKFYKEIVKFNERVTPEELQAFWNEHAADYRVAAARSGRLVISRNQAEAAKAAADARAGVPWQDILLNYGSDRDNKAKNGRLEAVKETEQGPVRDAIFALQDGQVSDPFPLENGAFGVVLCESSTPGRQAELAEVSQAVGDRIKKRREDEAFQAMLDTWRQELTVTIHKDRLDDLPSWEDLTAPAPPPGQPVPRA